MKIVRILLLFLLSSLAAAEVAHSQDKVDPKGIVKIRFQTSFSPSLFAGIGAEVTTTESIKIDSTPVDRKTHRLKEATFVTTDLCSSFDSPDTGNPIPGTMQPFFDEGELYRVKEYVSYEVGSKVFAYEINYDFFDSDSGEQMGATRTEFYVDKKGKGEFLIDCDVKDFRLTSIPAWVQKRKKP